MTKEVKNPGEVPLKKKGEGKDLADLMSFDEALKKLEEVTKQLETGEKDLEEAVALYTEGMRLTEICESRFEAARMTVERVTEKANQAKQAP